MRKTMRTLRENIYIGSFNKGITLVALVVTIIILLILTGITISVLSGNELFENAKLAKESERISELYEILQQKVYQIQIDKIGNATFKDLIETLDEDNLDYLIELGEASSINNEIPNLENARTIIVTVENYMFEIDLNFSIKYIGKNNAIYYNIEKQVPDEINIDNSISKIEQGKKFIATITAKDGYKIENINVMMGKMPVEVDKTTGKIIIERVTDNIKIVITSAKEQVKINNLQDFLINTNINLEMCDIFSTSFFSKIAISEEKKEEFLETENVIKKIIENPLWISNLNITLVPTTLTNTNVLYSSQYNEKYAGYMAFDKRDNYYWCSTQNNVNNQYIGYNLGEKKKVYFASFYNGCNEYNYRCKKVKLQCSNDNKTWIDASDEITLENTLKTCYIENTKEKENEYQYWRIFIISAYTTDYIVSSAVQFYGIKDIPNIEYKFEDREDKELLNKCTEELKNLLVKTDVKLTINDVFTEIFIEKVCEDTDTKEIFLELIKPLISQIIQENDMKVIKVIIDKFDMALVPTTLTNTNVLYSSQYNEEYAGYMAFDKRDNYYWCSTQYNVNNQHIGYNLGEKKKVYLASFYNGCKGYNYRCKKVKLQCSNDNKTWIDASDEITLENIKETCYIKNTKENENEYQYWRIFIISAYTTDYIASSAIQFFGW